MTKRFTDREVEIALQELEAGVSVGEVCRRAQVSENTLYRWRKERAPRLQASAGPPAPGLSTRLAAAELQIQALQSALRAVAGERELEQAARHVQLNFRMGVRHARQLVGLTVPQEVLAAAPQHAAG